jgi:hypothetical protein
MACLLRAQGAESLLPHKGKQVSWISADCSQINFEVEDSKSQRFSGYVVQSVAQTGVLLTSLASLPTHTVKAFLRQSPSLGTACALQGRRLRTGGMGRKRQYVASEPGCRVIQGFRFRPLVLTVCE